ncbi:hypothetical protein N866_01785 [Actinotalea ferrariae CF5-4]|uniref:Uncharacterized protein n=1 Tax=Actinotalea ferrariae CF5-4 TaxID=948458 RepID=A0A021VT79_9CELL|nr:hypothetical protein N866_01785 [Actinotalea ferrariae CF5-4]
MPPALRDRLDPVWADHAAVSELVAAYGLTLSLRGASLLRAAPPWARFDSFRKAWCQANGLMSDQWPDRIDQRRARAAGVDLSGSARYRLTEKG